MSTNVPKESSPHDQASPAGQRRMTLIEMGLVAIVLGTFAIMVVPHLAPADTNTPDSLLKQRLADVRSALELYRVEHDGAYPGFFTRDPATTQPIDGVIGDTSLVPYYLLIVPVNPYTQGGTIGSGPVGTSDWYYNPQTGEFRANDSDVHRRF